MGRFGVAGDSVSEKKRSEETTEIRELLPGGFVERTNDEHESTSAALPR